MNDRDGLALYRRLEFPNETELSWPIAKAGRDMKRVERWRREHLAEQRQPKPVEAV